jgi:beta-galactosidase
VYSKYPKVRLYLNNSLIAELPTTESQKYVATFTLPYAPGLLKAVGVQDSNALESTTLKTAGKPANIRLIADRTEISANGQDLSFVTVEIVDENGTIQPNAENPLQFTTRGPGKIVGVDNANLKDLDCYAGHTRKAWHGRAMVVIMSGRLAGDIELEASSPGLPAARVTIRSRRN